MNDQVQDTRLQELLTGKHEMGKKEKGTGRSRSVMLPIYPSNENKN